MQNLRFIYATVLTLLVLIGGATVLTALYAPVAQAASCNGTETVIISCGNKDNGVWSILLIVVNVMAMGVGILGVAGIVYGAFLYTTAADNESQVAKSKTTITNTVVGLVAFAFMYSGLQFLIPGGVFGTDGGLANREPTIKLRSYKPVKKANTSGSGASGMTKTSSPTKNNGKLALRNFRDASSSNNVLKPGVLFRASQLSSLTPASARQLSDEMGSGATIIDMRTPNQIQEFGNDKSVPNSRRVAIPIKGILDTAPMVTDGTRRSQLARVLRTAANANGPVLIHCVAGKDRTGWTVAMIMHIAGASQSQIMNEYMRSTESGFRVEREWLNSGLQTARSRYGSVDGYLKNGLGLSTGDINAIRKKFKA